MGWHKTYCGSDFLVDDKYDDFVRRKKWHLSGKYPATYLEGEKKDLHTIIARMNGMFGMIDHIDRNKWNNVLLNLRETTKSKDAANRGMQCNNTSGKIGVYQCEQTNKWFVQIQFESKLYHLSYYYDLDDAAYVRDIAAIFFRGPDAPELNFEHNREIYIQELKDNKFTDIYSLREYLKKKFNENSPESIEKKRDEFLKLIEEYATKRE